MAENWLGEVHRKLVDGLALGFVDRHSKRDLYRKLMSSDLKRKTNLSARQSNSRNQDVLSSKSAGHDGRVDAVRRETLNLQARSIAEPPLSIQVAHQEDRCTKFQPKPMSRDTTDIDGVEKLHRVQILLHIFRTRWSGSRGSRLEAVVGPLH